MKSTNPDGLFSLGKRKDPGYEVALLPYWYGLVVSDDKVTSSLRQYSSLWTSGENCFHNEQTGSWPSDNTKHHKAYILRSHPRFLYRLSILFQNFVKFVQGPTALTRFLSHSIFCLKRRSLSEFQCSNSSRRLYTTWQFLMKLGSFFNGIRNLCYTR